MLNVKYAGFGGYMEVPCYEDEKGKLYFDENNGIGGLNLYTGAYRDEFGDILGEPDKKVTEDVRCAEPFARHTRENDYRMLGRLKQDCEYFLGCGNGYEGHLYHGTVEKICEAMKMHCTIRMLRPIVMQWKSCGTHFQKLINRNGFQWKI